MDTKSLVMSNKRLSNLFDGVVSIAITLLILELKLPEVQGEGIGNLLHVVLREQFPEVVALAYQLHYDCQNLAGAAHNLRVHIQL